MKQIKQLKIIVVIGFFCVFLYILILFKNSRSTQNQMQKQINTQNQPQRNDNKRYQDQINTFRLTQINDSTWYQQQNQVDSQPLTTECWEKYIMDPSFNDALTKINYIPSKIEEAPIGSAPSIPLDFILEEKDYCSKRPSLLVIVYVHTTINIVDKREETRKTWASASKQIGVVFMVGRAKNTKESEIVQRESEKYHDIVQGNYTDLYRLLDYKALNSLYWVTKNCGQVPWVMHANDNVLVDVFKLLATLQMYDSAKRYNEMFCLKVVNSPTMRGLLDKWYVSYEEYPCETYPPYCLGSAWFTTMQAIKNMLKNVPLVKYLWVEDVFITGFLTVKSGIQLQNTQATYTKFNESEMENIYLWFNVHSDRIVYWLDILYYYNQKM